MAKSEYLQREEAAKKQLGAKGVKKRVKQLPTAARASLREMTGIDVSRKGVSVDPIGLAMAVSPFKLLKASKALRAAGRLDEAYSVAARAEAKFGGRELPKNIALAKKMFTGMSDSYNPKTASKVLQGGIQRENSLKVFPKLPSKGGDAPGLLRGQRDLRTFDRYADPYNIGNERVMGAAVSRPGGSIGEAAMPRIASKIKKPKLPKGRGGR